MPIQIIWGAELSWVYYPNLSLGQSEWPRGGREQGGLLSTFRLKKLGKGGLMTSPNQPLSSSGWETKDATGTQRKKFTETQKRRVVMEPIESPLNPRGYSDKLRPSATFHDQNEGISAECCTVNFICNLFLQPRL